MTSQQSKSVNTKSIACFPSSVFFVIIKRDFISDYLNVPAFTPEFLVRAPDDISAKKLKSYRRVLCEIL